MPSINENKLKEHISGGSLEKCYFLYGEESYLVKHYVKKLTASSVDDAFADFNLMHFDGAECTLDQIADFALSVPMMSPKKCAVIKDYNADKRNAADTKKLAELLSQLEDSTVLIFYTDLLEVSKKPSAKWNAFTKGVDSVGCSVYFSFKEDKELIRTLISGAKKRDCELIDRQAEYLIANCGKSLDVLVNELDKICSFTGSGTISQEKLELTVVKTLTAKVFDMVNALFAKNLPQALSILDDLFFQRQEAVDILGAISSSYVTVYRVRVATENGHRAEELMGVFNYRSAWQLTNADRNGKRLKKSSIRGCLEFIMAADEKLKSTAIDKKIVLEELLVKLYSRLVSA